MQMLLLVFPSILGVRRPRAWIGELVPFRDRMEDVGMKDTRPHPFGRAT
jgi:hypothetical protein